MKRVRSHIIEKKSDLFLEDIFDNWVCNKLNNDYGLDYNIIITEMKLQQKLVKLNKSQIFENY